jgi:membrane protein implicated in regulation of membrane protease activity
VELSTWAWVIAAVGIGGVSALARDRWTAPWAAGAAVAAVLDALKVGPAWPWIAFLVVSSVVFLVANLRRYIGRHTRGSHDDEDLAVADDHGVDTHV